MPTPEINEDELDAAMGDDVTEVQITNENAVIIMAQALVGIEKHLMALVYLENTKDSEKTGITYIADVFRAIYDGSDPFEEVDEAVKAAAKAGAEGNAG